MTNGDGRDTRADLIRRLRAFVSEFPPARLALTSPAIREAIGLIGEALAALEADATQGEGDVEGEPTGDLLAELDRVRAENSTLRKMLDGVEQQAGGLLAEDGTAFFTDGVGEWTIQQERARAARAEQEIARLREDRYALHRESDDNECRAAKAEAGVDRLRQQIWELRAALASAADAPREEK